MNKTKFVKRLTILFIFVIAIIAIIAPNGVQAVSSDQITADSVNTDSTWSSLPDSGTMDTGYGYLTGKWWVLCCQHGNAMKSVKLYLEKLATYEYLTPIDAYLMANMEDTNSGSYPDAGQVAWWQTGGGGSTTFTSIEDIITDSDIEEYTGKSIDQLTDEEIEAAYMTLVSQASNLEGSSTLLALAERFETYICMALGGISSDELGTESDYYYQEEIDGKTVNAFNLSDITFEFIDTDTEADGSFSQTDVEIDEDVYESNVYVVGPYKLNYYYDSEFSYISNSTVIVIKDGEKVELTYETDYYFKSVSSSGLDDNGMPLAGEEFYVIIKYQAGITEMEEISFEYTYTNAGGKYAKYDTYQYYCSVCGWCDESHTHTYCSYCGYYDVSSSHQHHVPTGEQNEDGNTIFEWRSYVSTVNKCYQNNTTQDFAVCAYGYMWTETKTDGKVYGNSTNIPIEKTTVNENNELVVVDGTFYFLIEIKRDGGDWEEFETISIQTTNGYGSGTSSTIYWDNDESAPEYRVTEVYYDEDQFTPVSVSNTEGTLTDGTTVTAQFNNIVQPNTGELQIDKVFSCLTEEEIEEIDETFTFTIIISGNFTYDGTSYTTDNPLTLTETISESDGWTKTISGFTWYGDPAPTYEVEEVQADNSKYELLSSSGATGTLKEDAVATATFDNKLKIFSYLRVDKTLASGEDPESGEVFYAKVTITGDFIYEGTVYESETLILDDGDSDDLITLNEANEWTWTSEKIIWTTDTAPEYTVEEANLDTTEYTNVSTEELTGNQVTVGSDEVLESELEENIVNCVKITNEEILKYGDIEIYKILETDDDSLAPTFEFAVTVTGTFIYEDVEYTDTSYTFNVSVTANGDPWISDMFYWTDEAPTYTVEEINISDEYTFVSISNNDKTVTSSMSINGDLIEEDTVIIKAINQTTVDTDTIKIKKIITGNTDYFETLSNDEKTFKFTVEITGVFAYEIEGDVSETDVEIDGETSKAITTTLDGLIITGYNSYSYDSTTNTTTINVGENTTEETLVIGISSTNDAGETTYDGVIEIIGENTWESGVITWSSTSLTPEYKVTEVDIPDYAELEGWSNETSTVTTSFIKGTVGGQATLIATNNIIYKEAWIELSKIAATTNISGNEFNFTVAIKGSFIYEGTTYTDETYTIDVTIEADGSSWLSSNIIWYGESAPTYEITENLTDDQTVDGVELVSITDNGRGTLVNGQTHHVDAINKKIGINRGRIQISKTYTVGGVEIEDVDFDFEITITFANGTSYTYDTTVKSGSSYRSGYFYWNEGEDAPAYTVTEINLPSGVTSTLTNNEGSLSDEEIIYVTANNSGGQSGYLSIVKNTSIEDKVADTDATGTFEFNVNVTGTFTYNGEYYEDDTMTLKVALEVTAGGSASWTSKEFTWTDEAPSYSVDETSCSSNYYLDSSDNSYGELSDGATVIATFNNILGPIEKITLTIDLGGTVWNDTEYEDGKISDTEVNGQIDEDEPGISGVKVTITRVIVDSNGNIITTLEGIYTDSDEAVEENWVYTDSNGNWTFEGLSVPALVSGETDYAEEIAAGTYMVSYDVTFSYDGQTYEPTTYLTTSSGDSAAYRNASTSERDAWLSDSMAYELASLRTTFNNKFAEIVGLSDMDVNGNTVGTTNYIDGTSTGIELNYTSEDSISLLNSDNTKKVSTLQTYDTDGTIYDDLLMTASTSTGGLTYPFDSLIHLASWDKDVDLYTGATVTTYNFSATYEYTKNINLGLVEREYTDVSIEKDLTQATVVVNGKVLKYKYNSSIDLSNEENWEEYLYKQIAVADAEIEYTLGLYASDYYYRASVYESDTELWSDLEAFYVDTKNFSSVGDALELEIYLTYTITVHNESETYDLEVNEIVDYYDSSFTIVTNNAETGATSTAYVETLQGEEVNETMELADVSTYSCVDRDGVTQTGTTDWYTYTGTITGSDDVEYKESRTTALDGIKIASGGTATITTTYKVDKDNIDGISDAITLGDKHNVTEVTNFSSYYKGTDTITGRVDKDSAPDNANIEELNETAYYEDDTDSAPVLTIELVDEDREINGLVWEDAETDTIEYSQTIGNGLYNSDEGDKTISGMTTELVETISIPTGEEDSEGNEVYKEYEFIWNTESTYIGNYSLYYLTGFDATTTTDSNGQYEFTGVAAGNYKVRFVYGDTEILTGNDGYEEVYNGQDYKSTTYQSGYSSITDSDGDGYTDNEWHDLSNEDLNSERVSDARDSEARRLVVAAQSEILTYDNTSVLATADDADADHSELFGDYETAKEENNIVEAEGYYMYAETAKLQLEIENVYDTDYETSEYNGYIVYTGTISSDSVSVGNDYIYEISNIDFGLEERSQTKLTLDKQIKEITLTTSDGEIILDAVYDIEYELGDDDTIDVSVTLNKWESTNYDQIASLNRSGSTQGYRYIMAEGTILQGATINVTYQLTVFNVGEADTCNVILTEIWDEINNEGKSDLYEEALQELTSPYYTASNGRVTYSDYDEKYQYGLYFGSIYYLGVDGTYSEDTMLVESTIHQIIDYIDPDVEFIDTDNLSTNQAWSTTTIDYLIENKLIDPEAIIVVDNDGNPVLMDTDGDGVYDKVRTYADGLGDETNSYAFLSDEVQQYITDSKNNVVVSIDDGSSSVNPSLVKATVPYSAEESYSDATASITLEVSRYYSSEEDANEIDNIAEIIKVENTVGRRDIRTIAGNAITYQIDWDSVDDNGYDDPEDITTETIEIYEIAGEEPDTDATEVITLTPPTGLSSTIDLVMQILAIIGCVGVILTVGIVLIKKKVLAK